MKEWQRTLGCGEASLAQVGQEVVLNGWVHRVRDHGQLLFVELRDRTGRVQVVFDQGRFPELHREAREWRSEYVVAVRGEVVRRLPGTENPQLATGQVEIHPDAVKVFSASRPLPFELEQAGKVDEILRLRYRYLDLRRPELQENLRLRHQFTLAAREWFSRHGFYEVTTPLLTRSTPEGARDYLVPSRLEPGSFYALPQSPQLFKQLLMVAGLERYVQFAHCFRDEDLRADRQPDFVQIDLEMSFVTQEDILQTVESMMAETLEAVGRKVLRPFPRLTYREAMERFGSDKPDLRIPYEIQDVSALMVESEINVFRGALEKGGRVKALAIPGAASFSRKEMDQMEEEAKSMGAPGLAWVAWQGEGLKGPLARFFFREGAWTPLGESLKDQLGFKEGSLVLFAAGPWQEALELLGHFRLQLGHRLGHALAGDHLLWVLEFPLFSWDGEAGRWEAQHHPFTLFHPEDESLFAEGRLGEIRAQSYDLVWNGFELGSGSLRIYQREWQERVLEILGFTPEEAQRRFGFLLDAFQYGVPPHGGMALGLERILMLLVGAKSIRDVIAFPKSASGTDPLTGAPAPVDPQQLRELGLQILLPPQARRVQ
ncbi:MAG: aspartate--tRNA ligase [Bacillota bacterium]|nr:aspartate--tRNA ligase [Bacillota bacterium]